MAFISECDLKLRRIHHVSGRLAVLVGEQGLDMTQTVKESLMFCSLHIQRTISITKRKTEQWINDIVVLKEKSVPVMCEMMTSVI